MIDTQNQGSCICAARQCDSCSNICACKTKLKYLRTEVAKTMPTCVGNVDPNTGNCTAYGNFIEDSGKLADKDRADCFQVQVASVLLSGRVKVNAGGTIFETTLSTLCRYPEHYFSRLLSPHWSTECHIVPEVFVDRNGKLFGYVLDFLRHGHLCCPQEIWLLEAIKLEAEYFCIKPLELLTDKIISKVKNRGVNRNLSIFSAPETSYSSCIQVSKNVQPTTVCVNPSSKSSPELKAVVMGSLYKKDPIGDESIHSGGHAFVVEKSASVVAGAVNAANNGHSLGTVLGDRSVGLIPRDMEIEGVNSVGKCVVEKRWESDNDSDDEAEYDYAVIEHRRRALINDDPEPPSVKMIENFDLGDQVLCTDADF